MKYTKTLSLLLIIYANICWVFAQNNKQKKMDIKFNVIYLN